MELTKNDTRMIQGLSVLAMVWLHLFDRSYEGLYQPILFLFGIPVSFYVAQLCDFCVMGFAFCSGYAHYRLSEENDYFSKRKISLLKLLIKYWIVLAVFCGISILVGKKDIMPGSPITLILSILTWSNAYNGAWWYLFVYILIVLMSPWLQKTVRTRSSALVLLCGFAVYFATYLIRFHLSFNNAFLFKLGPFGMTLFEYLVGSVAAKEQYFTKVFAVFGKWHKANRILIAMFLLAAILLGHTLIIPSLFVAPVTGMMLITIFHLWKKPAWITKGMEYIGNHSTHIWLTHMFFFWNPFKGLVYKAAYPIIIFVLLIGITTVVSILLNHVERKLFELFSI